MKFEFTGKDIENIIHKYLQDDLNLMVTKPPKLLIKGLGDPSKVVTAEANVTADGWKQKLKQEESDNE